MANSKSAQRKPRKAAGSGSTNGSAPKAKSASAKSASAKSSSAKTKSSAAKGSSAKTKSSSAKGSSARRASSRSSRSTKASSRSKPATAARAKPKASPTASSSPQNGGGESSPAVAERVSQAFGTAKDVAGKAKGPAVAVGAAAAGVAGGLLLKGRLQRKTVLGVPVPRSLGKPSLDVKSIAKTVGDVSQSFAKTSKAVSKDIEHAGEQAERIGKILS
jgi:hypothetical protein